MRPLREALISKDNRDWAEGSKDIFSILKKKSRGITGFDVYFKEMQEYPERIRYEFIAEPKKKDETDPVVLSKKAEEFVNAVLSTLIEMKMLTGKERANYIEDVCRDGNLYALRNVEYNQIIKVLPDIEEYIQKTMSQVFKNYSLSYFSLNVYFTPNKELELIRLSSKID